MNLDPAKARDLAIAELTRLLAPAGSLAASQNETNQHDNDSTITHKENNQMSITANNTASNISAKLAEDDTTFGTESIEAQTKTGLAALDALAGDMIKVDELFIDREDGGKQVLKPQAMTVEQLAMHAAREAEANAQKVEFTRRFKARPSDGAVAFHRVLHSIFGINATGKTVQSFFGTQRPEYRSVQIGMSKEGRSEFIDVPWGLMEFAPLDAQFTLGYDLDSDYGFCFTVTYVAPKRHQKRVKALFDAVEAYLAQNSIYRGKALEGVGSADRNTGEVIDPKITNPYNTDRTKIVYTEKVSRALENSIFGVIRNADALRKHGIPLGEKVLLEGPNGSGKTEAGMAAMQIALENGWTAIKARYDEDIAKVIAFAERVGGPAVVIVEDVEKLMVPATGSPQKMDQLLDLFDGAGAKGREVMLVMTSNHAHELTKSMSRPGRIDRIVRVADLDRPAFQRLFEVMVSPERLTNIDYDRLFDAFPECTPVWIVSAIRRAERSVIIRTGEPSSAFVTEDFLFEAEDLAEQHALHRTATDRPEKDTLTSIFEELVNEKLESQLRPLKKASQDYFGTAIV